MGTVKKLKAIFFGKKIILPAEIMHMKLLFFTFCLAAFTGMAQKEGPFPAADSITLTGLVNNPVTFPLSAITAMPDTTFTSLKIFSHKGEYKFTYEQVKAVLLKTLLQKNIASSLKNKEMNSLYFVCKAVDGFTVVYSYNELFNAAAGGIYVLTAHDNITIKNMPERPVILITGDNKSGKLFMRGMTAIDVRMAK